MSASPPRLAVLISGRGSNMLAIARACEERRIGAHLALVVADRQEAGGLALASARGVATRLVPFRDYTDRAAFERALIAAIDEHRADLVILAGFMRIFTPLFVSHYRGRLLNIHPSLLPKYPGLDTHRRALDARDTEHGASVHFVTEELDGGPVVIQARVPIRPGDDEHSLSARVHTGEHIIYPQAIDLIASGRVAWSPAGLTLDGQRLAKPIVVDVNDGG